MLGIRCRSWDYHAAWNVRISWYPSVPTGSPSNLHPGGPIRTLGVSLMAIAAVAVGVILSKQRQERPTPGITIPAGGVQPAEVKLDAIRAAGW